MHGKIVNDQLGVNSEKMIKIFDEISQDKSCELRAQHKVMTALHR
jgi:hypothetical protein